MNTKTLKELIYLYLEKHPPAFKLFYMLEKAGNIYLIGGVQREFRDNKELHSLRDIDIIIDVNNDEYWRKILSEFELKKNCFEGYKLFCSGLVIDFWPLDETWAYKNQIIKCSPSKYVESLTRTVFLNIDAIIYDLKRGIWYDSVYQQAMETKILDVILEWNPEIPLNVMRAIMLKRRYNLTYSIKLKNIIKEELKADKDYSETLMQIQQMRYKKVILSTKVIEEELMQIKE